MKLIFRAFHSQFNEELESSGEFLRDMAYVNIVDNDGECFDSYLPDALCNCLT